MLRGPQLPKESEISFRGLWGPEAVQNSVEKESKKRIFFNYVINSFSTPHRLSVPLAELLL